MVDLYSCKHCKTRYRVSFWRRRFPNRCPSCGKFTLFKPVKVKDKPLVESVKPVEKLRVVLRCFSCHHVWEVSRIVEPEYIHCPRCNGLNIWKSDGFGFWEKICDRMTGSDYEVEEKRRFIGNLWYFKRWGHKRKYKTRCSNCNKIIFTNMIPKPGRFLVCNECFVDELDNKIGYKKT